MVFSSIHKVNFAFLAANIQLPVPEATGAQRAVRGSSAVPRPAAFQFVAPPRDKEIVGNAWRHGKKFRHERKVKSAEKGKYG